MPCVMRLMNDMEIATQFTTYRRGSTTLQSMLNKNIIPATFRGSTSAVSAALFGELQNQQNFLVSVTL